jgi:tetratricopeptide (TPR) repeat protein
MFFLIVLITVVLTVAFGKLREYLKQKKIEELLKEFDYVEIENINVDKQSIDALTLLARAYEIKGDYEKALKIYLLIEKQENSPNILKSIANLYFKAGFLEKAKNVIYQVLNVYPRDREALRLLILIDEKLGMYDEILEVLDVFKELGVDLPKERANAIFKNQNWDVNGYIEFLTKYPFARREVVQKLFLLNPKKAYEILDVYEDLDLYFNRPDIPKSEKFCNVLAAKHIGKCDIKAPFEIEALKYLPKDLAELEFEYVCEKCKKIFPLYSTRCPKCYSLYSQKLIMKLSEKKNIENIEF